MLDELYYVVIINQQKEVCIVSALLTNDVLVFCCFTVEL